MTQRSLFDMWGTAVHVTSIAPSAPNPTRSARRTSSSVMHESSDDESSDDEDVPLEELLAVQQRRQRCSTGGSAAAVDVVDGCAVQRAKRRPRTWCRREVNDGALCSACSNPQSKRRCTGQVRVWSCSTQHRGTQRLERGAIRFKSLPVGGAPLPLSPEGVTRGCNASG